MIATYLGVAAVLLIGSFVQRVTGMGLALVASPFLVLLLGSTQGVQVLVVVGLGVCLASAWFLRRDINFRRALILLAASVIGLVPGALMARRLPAGWMSVVIGGVTLIALIVTRIIKHAAIFRGNPGTVLAGALSGFMNVTAGVGGPPIVMYARSIEWKYVEYVATVQAFFAGLNVLSIAGRGFPMLTWLMWIVVVVAAVGGTLIGNVVGARINEKLANQAIFFIALAGSVATVIRGLLTI